MSVRFSVALAVMLSLAHAHAAAASEPRSYQGPKAALAPTGSPPPVVSGDSSSVDNPESPESVEPLSNADDDEDAYDEDAYDEDAYDEDAFDSEYDPLRDSPQAVRARHWVRAGIALLSAGGAMTVGALVFATSDPCNLKAGNSCQPAARNRAALTMGVPALALIGGGAAALGVGLVQRRRLAVDVAVGRGSLYLGISGRF